MISRLPAHTQMRKKKTKFKTMDIVYNFKYILNIYIPSIINHNDGELATNISTVGRLLQEFKYILHLHAYM